jgi:hypothetical protein
MPELAGVEEEGRREMAATGRAQNDILAESNQAKRDEIIGLLTTAYWMEIERSATQL